MRADNTTRTVTSLSTEIIARQDDLPEAIKRAFTRTVGRAKSCEQMMWREVAARMVLDAYGLTPETVRVYDGMDRFRYARYRTAVLSARAWFRDSGEDVEQVFDMAGVELAPVLGSIRMLPPLLVPKSLGGREYTRRRTFGYIGKPVAA